MDGSFCNSGFSRSAAFGLLVLALVAAGCSAPKLPEVNLGEVATFPAKIPGLLNPFDKSSKEKKELRAEAEEHLTQPRNLTVGTIQLVHQSGQFVLIRTQGGMDLPATGTLFSYGPDMRPTAELRLSGERKSGFLVADIVKGDPVAGDSVIFHQDPVLPPARSSDTGTEIQYLE